MSPDAPITLAAIARPGDTIVVGFGSRLSDDDVADILENWKPLTDKGIWIAFADNVTSMTVIRPEGDDIGCPPGCVSPFCDCPGTD